MFKLELLVDMWVMRELDAQAGASGRVRTLHAAVAGPGTELQA